jgi:hypothetical protein
MYYNSVLGQRVFARTIPPVFQSGKLVRIFPRRLEIFDDVVPSMALRITSKGARSFIVRRRVKGQTNPLRVTLGDAPAMKLSDARTAASEAARHCRPGVHRSQARWKAARRAALVWEAVVERFLSEHASRSKSGSQGLLLPGAGAGITSFLQHHDALKQ